MEREEWVFYALITALLALAAYIYLFDSGPDVDPFVLTVQSSVSQMRLPHETAVYRSRVVPHGARGLLTGLAIGGGSGGRMGPTRDGTIEDLWALALKAKISTFSFGQLESISPQQLSSAVESLGGLISRNSANTVVVALPNSAESLICLFAGALHGVQVVFAPMNDELDKYVRFCKATVVVTTGELAELLIQNTNVGTIVFTGKRQLQGPHLVPWDHAISNPKQAGDALKKAIDPPMAMVYSSGEKIVLTTVSNQNIVSAVASQLKALPIKEQWNNKDTVVSCTTELSNHTIVHNVAALAVGAHLVLPESTSSVNLFLLVSTIKPTILVTDDETSLSLAARSERLKALHLVQLQIALNTLRLGKLPTHSYIIRDFASVRLVHSGALQDEPALSDKDANLIRALTGARLIHSLYVPLCLSPIAQTNIYDYRAGEPGVINFGAPMACLELKLKDHGLYQASERKGQIWIQGPAVTEEPQWVNTGLIALFGPDGALKIHS
uniref:ARAD1D49104p n=1 Tax=Blastobotrys adeninivorans TaxID=409370 RepID=A0A060TIT0_BLAAD